jgi:hypothetical protein
MKWQGAVWAAAGRAPRAAWARPSEARRSARRRLIEVRLLEADDDAARRGRHGWHAKVVRRPK